MTDGQAALSEALATVAAQPTAENWWQLGNVYADLARWPEAIAAYDRGLLLHPTAPQWHFKRGYALAANHQVPEAIAAYERAIALDPNFAKPKINLAILWADTERQAEAAQLLQEAIALEPNWPQPYVNLAVLWIRYGRWAEAEALLQKALQLNPRYAGALTNLGNLYVQQERYAEAEQVLTQALDLDPHHGLAHWNFSVYLWQVHRHDHAQRRAAAQRYREQVPDDLRATIQYASVCMDSGLGDEAAAQIPLIEAGMAQPRAPWDILYQSFVYALPHLRDDRPRNSATCRTIGQNYRVQTLQPLVNALPKGTPGRGGGEKLRLGFLSPSLGAHAIGWLCRDWWPALAERVEALYVYAYGHAAESPLLNHYRHYSTAYRFYPERGAIPTVTGILADMAADRLDVLIDTEANLQPLHPLVWLTRPAPLTVSWLGFDAPYLSADHYWLGDWQTHPPAAEPFYVEKLARLPHAHIACGGFDGDPVAPGTLRQSLNLDPEAVVFLSVAAARKLNEATIEAQLRILQRVPHAVLVRKGFGDRSVVTALYTEKAKELGVDPDRLRVLPAAPTEAAHRAWYGVADVVLDSYPYNGGTNNLEALWFERPLVTLCGQQSFARMGYSFLHTLGIAEGVAHSWEEYVAWGETLGRDRDLRIHLQERLRQAKDPATLSPLWNVDQFAADFVAVLSGLLATLP
ncbi:MAG: O-linked N-acetylglucosamine transferase, SPINDLY family protein [Pseudanabaenaceae cyanobacterium]